MPLISFNQDLTAGTIIANQLEEVDSSNSEFDLLLDIDLPSGSIIFYDENDRAIETVDLKDLGDNSFQKIDFNLGDLARLEFDLSIGGAATEIDIEPEPDNSFSKIYAFGDSLVDTGNLFNATAAVADSSALPDSDLTAIPPSPPYFEGRFSNGQIWLDNLAEELNIDLTPATELSTVAPGSDILSPVTVVDGNPAVSPFFNGSTTSQSISVNFAYGLATTGASGTGELGSLVPGIEQQVEFFVSDHQQANKTADADALYVLWGGSNDYFLADADPEQTVANLETHIESLYDLGGRSFLVVNLPDLGLLPEANNPNLPTSPEGLSELATTHNLLLESGVEALEDTLTGADITVLDANSLFDDILANSDEFGFTNVTEPFLDPLTFTPTVGANPDEYLFFDNLHPTQAASELLGNLAIETLTAEVDI